GGKHLGQAARKLVNKSTPMRVCQLMIALFTAVAASVLPGNGINGGIAAWADCRSGFTYYQGWCVYVYNYYTDMNHCRTVGAFAPSVHSQDELDFWVNIMKYFNVANSQYWLDAYCPSEGEP
ncbi:hypothetical protein PMAYCL1PPCAC_26008, partial [Pristionchus mayeri]